MRISFDSTASLYPLAILQKFKFYFWKKSIYFPKKPQFLNLLRFFTIPVAFTANLQQFSKKVFSRSDVNKNAAVGVWRERNWQTSGKNTLEIADLRGRFCFHILNMAQNNKTSSKPVATQFEEPKNMETHSSTEVAAQLKKSEKVDILPAQLTTPLTEPRDSGIHLKQTKTHCRECKQD